MTTKELEQCITMYGKDIYSFCRHLTLNQTEADDLYQDTFLKLLELQDKIDVTNNPKSYLLSIALRIWKNRKRKYAWRKRIAEEQDSFFDPDENDCENPNSSLDAQIIRREENLLVKQTVARLPEHFRLIILFYYMEELSVAEIASILKLPEGTVKSRLFHARKQLEKELEDVLDEKRN